MRNKGSTVINSAEKREQKWCGSGGGEVLVGGGGTLSITSEENGKKTGAARNPKRKGEGTKREKRRVEKLTGDKAVCHCKRNTEHVFAQEGQQKGDQAKQHNGQLLEGRPSEIG